MKVSLPLLKMMFYFLVVFSCGAPTYYHGHQYHDKVTKLRIENYFSIFRLFSMKQMKSVLLEENPRYMREGRMGSEASS